MQLHKKYSTWTKKSVSLKRKGTEIATTKIKFFFFFCNYYLKLKFINIISKNILL